MRKLEPLWSAALTTLAVCYGAWAATHIYTGITGQDSGYGKFGVLLLSPIIFCLAATATGFLLNLILGAIDTPLGRTGILLAGFGIFIYGFHFVPTAKEKKAEARENKMMADHLAAEKRKQEQDQIQAEKSKIEKEERFLLEQTKYENDKKYLEEEITRVAHAPAGIVPTQIKIEKVSGDGRHLKVTNVSDLPLRIILNSVQTHLGPSDVIARDRYQIFVELGQHRTADYSSILMPGKSHEVYLPEDTPLGKLEFEILDMASGKHLFKSETAFYPVPPKRKQ